MGPQSKFADHQYRRAVSWVIFACVRPEFDLVIDIRTREDDRAGGLGLDSAGGLASKHVDPIRRSSPRSEVVANRWLVEVDLMPPTTCARDFGYEHAVSRLRPGRRLFDGDRRFRSTRDLPGNSLRPDSETSPRTPSRSPSEAATEPCLLAVPLTTI
jgi:hypothetical protein